MNTFALPQYHNWMARTPQIGNLRIDELILPGTHNSGSDKKSPNFGLFQEFTQDLSPLEQLQAGIRVLDLRVSFYEKYPQGDARRFQLFHLTSSGRTIKVDIIQMLETFYQPLRASGTPPREIVILDFHQFQNFTDTAHSQLQQLLIEGLGSRLIRQSLRKLTVADIWQAHPGKTVMVAYNHYTNSDFFTDGVNQRWSGKNLISTRDLKTFMDSVAEEYRPAYELHAIQCAKYVLPFHTPDDFSDKIDLWFESVDETSYIQKFCIINTDWSLRSQVVKNCVHANTVKARARQRQRGRAVSVE